MVNQGCLAKGLDRGPLTYVNAAFGRSTLACRRL